MLTAGIGGLYLCLTEVLNHGNLNSHGLASMQFIILFSVDHVVRPEGHIPKVGLLPGFDRSDLRCKTDLRTEMSGNCSSDSGKCLYMG